MSSLQKQVYYRVDASNTLFLIIVIIASFFFSHPVKANSVGFTPVDVAGWNQDLIIENNAVLPFSNFATTSLDGSTYFYEQGLSGGSSGLPSSGSIYVSQINATFAIRPYNQMNALFLPDSASHTLTLTAPQSISKLAILASSAGAPAIAEGGIKIHWSNGSMTSGLLYSAPDWFFGSTGNSSGAYGRVNSSGGFQDEFIAAQLFYSVIDLSSDPNFLSGNQIDSLDFTRASGSYEAYSTSILGVSAVPDSAGTGLLMAFGFIALVLFSSRSRKWCRDVNC